MKFNSCEIKVALLGNVSAGKTTVLNSLFKDKYGEVSMKRTTAGVNYFRVVTPGRVEENDKEPVEEQREVQKDEQQEGQQKTQWCPEAGETRSASSTLEEIIKDNKILRESDVVQEKWFDIELDEHLMEMREDTHLVVVDVPGINEAGASNKYKNYVNEKWTTFDCIIAVMDGKQGVNTEDQVYLLNLIRSNILSKKEMPVIILFNKVDDPADQEQAELIKEASKEVDRIFSTKTDTNPFASFSQAKPNTTNTSSFSFGSTFGTSASTTKTTVPAPVPAFSFGTASPAGTSSPFSFAPKTKSRFSKAKSRVSAPIPAPTASTNSSRTDTSPFASFSQPKTNATAANAQVPKTSTFSFESTFGAPANTTKTTFSAPVPGFSFGNAAGASTPATGSEFNFGSTGESQKTNAAAASGTTPTCSSGENEPQSSGTSHESPPLIHSAINTPLPPDAKTDVAVPSTPSVSAFTALSSKTKKICPVEFVPVSAMYAFIYQSASTMTLEQFQQFFDKDLIEKTGRFQIGQRRWNKLSEEERIQETFDAVSDPSMQHEALEDSNFVKFLAVLRAHVGGKDTQLKLLERQVRCSLKEAGDPSSRIFITECIKTAHGRIEALRGQANMSDAETDLKKAFWEAYNVRAEARLTSFISGGPRSVHLLADPMSELVAFSKLCKALRWEEELLIKKHMRLFIGNVISQLCEEYRAPTAQWELAELAWYEIWSSMLLVAYSKPFCVTFGKLKRLIESAAREADKKHHKLIEGFRFAEGGEFQLCPSSNQPQCPSCGNVCCSRDDYSRWCNACKMMFYKGPLYPYKCPHCQEARPCRRAQNKRDACSYPYHDIAKGNMVKENTRMVWNKANQTMSPVSPIQYRMYVPFDVPDSLEDPRHFGHFLYLWCEFMENEDRVRRDSQ